MILESRRENVKNAARDGRPGIKRPMRPRSRPGTLKRMSEEAPISVIVYASDLMFRSRISAEARAAGRRATAATTTTQLPDKLGASPITLILVDMDMPDAAEAIRISRQLGPAVPIVAYYSHVRDDLRKAATGAGATHIMPRSQFVVRLPELLHENAG